MMSNSSVYNSAYYMYDLSTFFSCVVFQLIVTFNNSRDAYMNCIRSTRFPQLTLLLVLVFLSSYTGLVAPAKAAATNEPQSLEQAAELVRICKAVLDISKTTTITDESFPKTPCGAYLQGFATGFGTGAHQAFEAAGLSGEQRLTVNMKLNQIACLPYGISLRELANSFLNWSRENPDTTIKDSSAALLASWRSTFPCK